MLSRVQGVHMRSLCRVKKHLDGTIQTGTREFCNDLYAKPLLLVTLSLITFHREIKFCMLPCAKGAAARQTVWLKVYLFYGRKFRLDCLSDRKTHYQKD